MLFRKNHRLPAAARPYSLKVLFIFAAVICWFWAALIYLMCPEVWPLPSGGLYFWWPMYACFGVIAVLGLYCRWGYVMPCFLLSSFYGNLCLGLILPLPIKSSAVLHEAVLMFLSSVIGVAIGVWLDRRVPE